MTRDGVSLHPAATSPRTAVTMMLAAFRSQGVPNFPDGRPLEVDVHGRWCRSS